MQRFLIFVGVAVVAAAMYVAASPASQRAQQAKGPSAKQFSALKKQVAALKKDETAVKKLTIALADIVGGCYLDSKGNLITLPVSQVGTTTLGFLFGAPGTPPASATARTALDINAASPTADLQEVNPTCLSASGLKHGTGRSGVTRLRLWTGRTH
ncbi:MAG TPA: hypothetical protein VGH46_07335 [Gaiellaceae bacterium]|jgi:hypothetical protein